MTKQKTSKFGNFMGKLLYSLMVANHHEDYICENANGETVTIPAKIWHVKAMESLQQKR